MNRLTNPSIQTVRGMVGIDLAFSTALEVDASASKNCIAGNTR